MHPRSGQPESLPNKLGLIDYVKTFHDMPKRREQSRCHSLRKVEMVPSPSLLSSTWAKAML